MNFNRVIYVAGYFYKELVKPMTVMSAVSSIYTAGACNAIADTNIYNQRMPVYMHLFSMTKSAVFGTIAGVTFPVSFPILFLHSIYSENKVLKEIEANEKELIEIIREREELRIENERKLERIRRDADIEIEQIRMGIERIEREEILREIEERERKREAELKEQLEREE